MSTGPPNQGASHHSKSWISAKIQYGTFAMFPDLGYIKWFNTLPGRVRWVGYAPKPLETCLVRPGAGASSPETVMRFHSNHHHHESLHARLDQAHAPTTTPKRTKATSPKTLWLRWAGKEVEKGVGRPQVAGNKSSMAVCDETGHGSGNPSARWKERSSCRGERQQSPTRFDLGMQQDSGKLGGRAAI